MLRLFKIVALVAAFALVGVTAQANEPAKTNTMAPAKKEAASSSSTTTTTTTTATKSSTANADIVTTAMSAGNFKTLTNLLQSAGLVDTLKGPGPFTVFAPTDAAFAKLPAGTLEDLMKPESKAKLRSILTYHVAPGKLNSADLTGKQLTQNTVQGSSLSISGSPSGSITVGSAKVSGAEVLCSNGAIYAIDTVLMPPSAPAKQM